MTELGNLVIEGFLSITTRMEVNLNMKQIVWVKGRNGVGKSTMVESIPWTLYGKTFKGVSDVNSWEHVRPKGYKGTMCSVYFRDNLGNIYQVIRCQSYTGKVEGAKGKDRLIFLINGNETKSKRKQEIQKEIDKAFGMGWDIFKNSVMFGQGAKRLIQETNTDKKKLFEGLFDIGWINQSREYATKEYNKVKIKHQELTESIKHKQTLYNDSKDTYKDLKRSEENFNKDNKKLIRECKEELSECKNDKRDLSIMESTLAKNENDLAGIESILNQSRKQYREHKEKIQDITSSDGFYSFITRIIKLVTKNPKKAIEKLKELRGLIDNQTNMLETISELERNKSIKETQVRDCRKHVNEIRYNQEKIQRLEKRIEELKSRDVKVTSHKYKEKATKIKKELLVLKDKLPSIEKELTDWQWVINEPFGNKGIKSYIIESNLDNLNNILESYTDIIGYRIEFGIDLNSVKKDFYALIEMNGHIVEYEDLSGGQKQLVHVAMAFAMHQIKGVPILILDEVFESLSKDNIEIVVELIKSMSYNKTIFLLSHQPSLPLGNCKVLQLDHQKGSTVFK